MAANPRMGDTRTAGSEDADVELAARLRHCIVSPGEPEYDQARRVWNGLVDKRPALIVRCRDVTDVVDGVRLAKQARLPIAVRAGGHHVAGSAVIDGGVVLDLSAMRAVAVDAGSGTVRVAGGARIADVDRETQRFGLVVPLGIVSDTGVAGLTLGGGLGWLRRQYGLSSDNLLSADVVTADARVVRASREENPDLFWALRGGGWDLGAVVSFEYQAYPVGPDVFFSFVTFALDEARDVLRRYRDYMASAPREAATLATCWTYPDDASFPAELRGRPFVGVIGPYVGSIEDGEREHEILLRLGTVLTDRSGPTPWSTVQRFFDEDYPSGRRYYWRSSYIAEFSDACIGEVISMAERRPSTLSSIDVWPLGGAIGDVEPTASPHAHRHAAWALGIEANWDGAEHDAANIAWTREAGRRFEPFSTGGGYLNFGDPDDVRATADAYGQNLERLRAIKHELDPDNLFRSRRGLV